MDSACGPQPRRVAAGAKGRVLQTQARRLPRQGRVIWFNGSHHGMPSSGAVDTRKTELWKLLKVTNFDRKPARPWAVHPEQGCAAHGVGIIYFSWDASNTPMQSLSL